MKNVSWPKCSSVYVNQSSGLRREAAIAEKRNGCSSPGVTIPQPSGVAGAAVPKLPPTCQRQHIPCTGAHSTSQAGTPLQDSPHNASFGLSFSTWGTLRHRSPFLSLIFAVGWLLMHCFKGIDFNPCFQAAVCKKANFLHTSDQGDSSGTGRARTGPVQQEETEYCYFK